MEFKVAHQIYTQEYLNSLPDDDLRRKIWLGRDPKAENARKELGWLLDFGKRFGLLDKQMVNQLRDNDYRQCESAYNELRVAAFLDERFPSKLKPRPAGKGRKIGEYKLELWPPIFIEVKSLFEDFGQGLQEVRLPQRFPDKADAAEAKFSKDDLCMTIFCTELPADMSEQAMLYFLFSYPHVDCQTGKIFYKREGYLQLDQHLKVSALAIYNPDPLTGSFDGSLAVYHNPYASKKINYSLLRKEGIEQYAQLDSENFGKVD